MPSRAGTEARSESHVNRSRSICRVSTFAGEWRRSAGGRGGAEAGDHFALAGRQVAAAFGELSEAFAARSKKTFDELAEQMLRPMLQDWLDNNLPMLVERLVREEIERVARGVAVSTSRRSRRRIERRSLIRSQWRKRQPCRAELVRLHRIV